MVSAAARSGSSMAAPKSTALQPSPTFVLPPSQAPQSLQAGWSHAAQRPSSWPIDCRLGCASFAHEKVLLPVRACSRVASGVELLRRPAPRPLNTDAPWRRLSKQYLSNNRCLDFPKITYLGRMVPTYSDLRHSPSHLFLSFDR